MLALDYICEPSCIWTYVNVTWTLIQCLLTVCS